LLEARDRVSERPGAVFLLGAVAGRVIARRMSRGAIGHLLDEGGPGALAPALRRPLGDRVDGEEVVAIDADARNAIARPTLREGAVLAAGESLEGGDRPLVVNQVEDHRRLVDGGKGHRVVEIRFGARALADPARGKVILTFDRGRHRPTDR